MSKRLFCALLFGVVAASAAPASATTTSRNCQVCGSALGIICDATGGDVSVLGFTVVDCP